MVGAVNPAKIPCSESGMSAACSGDELWQCISRQCPSGSFPVPLEGDFPPGSSSCEFSSTGVPQECL